MGQGAVVVHSQEPRELTLRLMGAFEPCVVLALIICRLWFLPGRTIGGFFVACVLLPSILIVGWRKRKETLASLGLIGKWWIVPWVLLGAGMMVVHQYHLFPRPDIFWKTCLGIAWYAPRSLAQEIALDAFFALRLKDLLGSRLFAGLLGGLIFCGCHLPNPLLMPVGLAWGTISCWIFLWMRRRNLYILSLIHATVGYWLITVFAPHFMPWMSHPGAVARGMLP